MEKTFLYFIAIMVLAFSTTACKTQEERVMDRLQKLSEDVQKNGADWDMDQWADACEELEDIHYDMKDCEFTSEQKRMVGRMEGRLTVIIMTEGAKKMGNSLIDFVEGAGSFMKGYAEGVESAGSYSLEELKDYEAQLNERLEDLQTDNIDD